jgi:hypothetical protein
MRRNGRTKFPFEADLEEMGWKYNRHCMCGGTLKIYYRKGIKELKALPNAGRYSVKEGRTVTTGRISDMKTLLAGA